MSTALATIPYDMTASHVPVLAGELIDLTDPQPGEVVVDCTFGAGGHARLMAERVGPDGLVVCIDRDPTTRRHFDALAAEVDCALRYVPASFAEGLELLGDEGLVADVVYADLGLSSMQVDTFARGFAYSYDAPLDMRMDPGQELDARTLVNTADEHDLARILRDLGDERFHRQIARAIVRARPLETTAQLVEVLSSAIPARARFAGGHPAKRTFQALRMAVNDELGQLDAMLPLAWELLRPETGRFAGISFHSGEDRRVKRFLAAAAQGCICPPDLPVCACGRTPGAEVLTRRAVSASAGEVAANPRSASAKLRVARKLEVQA